MANIKDLIQSIESSGSSFDEKLAAINAMEETLVAMRAQEQEAIDDNVSLIVESIKAMQRKVEAQLEVVKAIVPEKGAPGRDGKDGKAGPAGRDGLPGRDGQGGKAGVNGQDGRDGVSIVDAYISADNSLVLRLSNGGEIDAGSLDLFSGPGGNSFSVLKQTQDTAELVNIFIQKTFETVNKNLAASNGVLGYNANGDLITINYTNGVVKTLAYDANSDLSSITLSGNTPESIDLTKTFSYDAGGNLVNFTYG
jgi:YD repeat-containing protein